MLLFIVFFTLGLRLMFILLPTSASMEHKNSTTVEPSEYDVIHHDYPYGYEAIEEVGEKDDILLSIFPPQHDFLPSTGYSGLMPDEPAPPGVYSRMEHCENSVEDRESEVDRSNLQSDIDGPKHDHSKLSGVKDASMKITHTHSTDISS